MSPEQQAPGATVAAPGALHTVWWNLGAKGLLNRVEHGILVLTHHQENGAIVQGLQTCGTGNVILIGQVLLKTLLLLIDKALQPLLDLLALALCGKERRLRSPR